MNLNNWIFQIFRKNQLQQYVQTITQMAILIVCILLPFSVFSEHKNFQLQPGIGPTAGKFNGKNQILSARFKTTVEVIAECVYPHLYGDDSLINYVNKKIERTAHDLFEKFVEQEKMNEEELNDDFGGCYLDYHLFPAYLLPNLISIYGSESQSRACPHGWTHHEGKNFWKKDNSIIEIQLKDLFIKESGWCNFLLHYCDHYFKSSGYGYYGQDCGFTPELEPEDLETFLITDHGLMIVFRSYKVGGWADGPDVIAIRYDKLKEFIDPNGPLREVPGYRSLSSIGISVIDE
jgi:hypothetical protein